WPEKDTGPRGNSQAGTFYVSVDAQRPASLPWRQLHADAVRLRLPVLPAPAGDRAIGEHHGDQLAPGHRVAGGHAWLRVVEDLVELAFRQVAGRAMRSVGLHHHRDGIAIDTED